MNALLRAAEAALGEARRFAGRHPQYAGVEKVFFYGILAGRTVKVAVCPAGDYGCAECFGAGCSCCNYMGYAPWRAYPTINGDPAWRGGVAEEIEEAAARAVVVPAVPPFSPSRAAKVFAALGLRGRLRREAVTAKVEWETLCSTARKRTVEQVRAALHKG